MLCMQAPISLSDISREDEKGLYVKPEEFLPEKAILNNTGQCLILYKASSQFCK